MMKIFNLFLIGFSFISFFIYVIFKRLANITKSKILFENVSWEALLYAYFLSILFFLLVCISLYKILKRKKPSYDLSLIGKILAKKIDYYYHQPLDIIQEKFRLFLKTKYNININWYIDIFVEIFSKYIHENNFLFPALNFKAVFLTKYCWLFIIAKIIPRIILICIFVLEVLYFNRLKYFYILAPLLFLPLLLRYLLYIIEQRYKKTLTALDRKFEVLDVEKEHIKGIFTVSIEEYFHRSVVFFLKNKKNPYQKFIIKLEYLRSRSPEQKQKGDIDFEKTIANALPFISSTSKAYLVLWYSKQMQGKFESYIDFFIKVLYCNTWIFIAIVLTKNYNVDSISLLISISSEDPFSGTMIVIKQVKSLAI